MFDGMHVLFKSVLYERVVPEPTDRWRSGQPRSLGTPAPHLKRWPRQSNTDERGYAAHDRIKTPVMAGATP